jgi:hypothetical protein
MRTRSFVAGAAPIVGLLFCLSARTAHADPKAEVQQKIKEGMENYDLMDYDNAKKALNQAIDKGKKGKLEKDPVLARAYLDLGIVAFAVPDQDQAKSSFASAVKIDPKIQIDAAYKSAELAKLLDDVRRNGGSASIDTGGPSTGPDLGESVDCKSVKGVQHTILDSGKGGVAQPMDALIGSDVKATKVSIMYRPEGATDFVEAQMTKQGDCKYVGAVPAKGMHGSVVHYYIAAYDGGNKPVASVGSAGSPNIMELTAGGVASKVDSEDPIGGGGSAKVTAPADHADTSINNGVIAGGKPPHVMLTVAGGTGFGYVQGLTEGGNMVHSCCVGNSLVVVTPELAYYITPKVSVGVAARVGVPVGANVDGHATAAPGGLVRVRYTLSQSGEGLRLMGQAGVGFIRNTIKLDNGMPGMDTDIVAQGPLLIGAGIGYAKRIGGAIFFVADAAALGGIAVVKTLGTSTLTNGIGADMSLGLALGF